MQDTLSPVGSAYLPYFLQAQSICLTLSTDSFPQPKLLDDLLHVRRLATSALTLKLGTGLGLKLRVGVRLWTGVQAQAQTEAQMFRCSTIRLWGISQVFHPSFVCSSMRSCSTRFLGSGVSSCEYLPVHLKSITVDLSQPCIGEV